MKSEKIVTLSTIAFALSTASAMAYVPVQALSPQDTYKVKQIVDACLVITKTAQLVNGTLDVAQAQIRPGCQNYIRYNERGNTGFGAINLGNELIQFKIITSDGMDADENEIQFAENGKIIGSYNLTDDSIENGLAVLKSIF
jgi:hypothetical protein